MKGNSNKVSNSLNSETVQRSEKVRVMGGDIPPRLLVIGLAVMLLIIFLLVAAVVLLPYPYSEGESVLQHIMGGYGETE